MIQGDKFDAENETTKNASNITFNRATWFDVAKLAVT